MMEQEIELLISEFRTLGGALGEHTRRQQSLKRPFTRDDADSDPNYYTNKVKKTTRDAVDSITGFGNFFSKSTDDAVSSFAKTIREHFTIMGVSVGAAMAVPLEYFHSVTKTYKELADVGQSFSGDIFELSRSAAEAGLGTEQYAKYVKENSVIASQLGRNNFATLARNVWDTNVNFSKLQISIDDQNEITAAYSETMRREKRLNGDASQKSVVEIQNMTKNVSDLSNIFGTSRMAIVKASEEAMRDPLLLGKTLQMTNAQMDSYNSSLRTATETLAAQPGEVGKLMPLMLSQTAGAGSGIWSDFGKKLVESGLTPMIGVFDNYANKIAIGGLNQSEIVDATMDALSQSEKYIGSQLPMLKAQAMAGNHSAAEMISFYSEIHTMTAEERMKKLEDVAQENKLKDAFQNLEKTWHDASSEVRKVVFDKLGKAAEWLSEKMKAITFDPIAKRVEDWTDIIGKWLVATFGDDPEKIINNLMDGIAAVGTGIGKFVSWVTESKTHLEIFGAGLLVLAVGVGNVAGMLSLAWSAATGIYAAAAGVVAAFTSLGVGGVLTEFVGRMAAAVPVVAALVDAFVIGTTFINAYFKTKNQNDTIDKMVSGGKMSGDQGDSEKTKNAVAETAGALGSLSGMALGAAIGTFVLPGIGTIVGGAIGHFVGEFIGANGALSTAFNQFSRWVSGSALDENGNEIQRKSIIASISESLSSAGNYVFDMFKSVGSCIYDTFKGIWDKIVSFLPSWATPNAKTGAASGAAIGSVLGQVGALAGGAIGYFSGPSDNSATQINAGSSSDVANGALAGGAIGYFSGPSDNSATQINAGSSSDVANAALSQSTDDLKRQTAEFISQNINTLDPKVLTDIRDFIKTLSDHSYVNIAQAQQQLSNLENIANSTHKTNQVIRDQPN